MKNGFIGLGNIGILIARDLAASGHELTVYDVMPDGPEELRKKGARVAASREGFGGSPNSSRRTRSIAMT